MDGLEKDKESPGAGEDLVVRVKGASIDKTLDQLLQLALAEINVKGIKSHIDDEFIFRELVSLVKKPRTRDSVKHDSIRTLAQLLGYLGPTDRSAQPAAVHVHFSESLAPDAKPDKAEGDGPVARGTGGKAGVDGKGEGG